MQKNSNHHVLHTCKVRVGHTLTVAYNGWCLSTLLKQGREGGTQEFALAETRTYKEACRNHWDFLCLEKYMLLEQDIRVFQVLNFEG